MCVETTLGGEETGDHGALGERNMMLRLPVRLVTRIAADLDGGCPADDLQLKRAEGSICAPATERRARASRVRSR